MPSYVITGVSKGIGWAFMKELSSDPNNTVIGLVRDKPAVEQSVASELGGRSNIHILYGDVTKYDQLKKAADETAKITGGVVDYLVANAAYLTTFDQFDPIGELGRDVEGLNNHFRNNMETNVLGNIHLINLFMPLILQSKIKKVTVISSGMGDWDMVNNYDIENAAIYGASKSAMNMITAKFSAQYKKDGVLFLSVCPGMVDTGHLNPSELPLEHQQALGRMVEKFKAYSPGFSGPDTPDNSVKAVLSVIEARSIAKRDGGNFLSHFNNDRWI